MEAPLVIYIGRSKYTCNIIQGPLRPSEHISLAGMIDLLVIRWCLFQLTECQWLGL